ncbi:MAG: oligosaccharide flippase family protein, partial [Acidobacteriota bacterium]
MAWDLSKVKILDRGILDPDTTEVARGAVVALTLKVAAAVVALALNVVLVRMLGPDNAGIYYLSLSIVTVAGVFGRVGTDNTVVRFVAASTASSDWQRIGQIYRNVTSIVLVAAMVAFSCFFLLSRPIAQGLARNLELTAPLR